MGIHANTAKAASQSLETLRSSTLFPDPAVLLRPGELSKAPGHFRISKDHPTQQRQKLDFAGCHTSSFPSFLCSPFFPPLPLLALISLSLLSPLPHLLAPPPFPTPSFIPHSLHQHGSHSSPQAALRMKGTEMLQGTDLEQLQFQTLLLPGT